MDAQLAEIDERGYAIVRHAFSGDLADELVETLDRLEHDMNVVLRDTVAFETNQAKMS